MHCKWCSPCTYSGLGIWRRLAGMSSRELQMLPFFGSWVFTRCKMTSAVLFFGSASSFVSCLGVSTCREVRRKALHVAQTFLPRQSFFIWPYFKHPKHRPLDLTTSILSVCDNFPHSSKLRVSLKSLMSRLIFLYFLRTSRDALDTWWCPLKVTAEPRNSPFDLCLLFLFLYSLHGDWIESNSSLAL